MASTSRTVDGFVTRLHFEVLGDEGPAVVLLHGLAGHGGEWQASAGLLSQHHRVVVMDQRAHGSSTSRPQDLSREAFADDVAAVLAAAGERAPVVLVGQSMGAHTALVVTERHPHLVSHLVMVEGDVGGGGEAPLAHVVDQMASIPTAFAAREEVSAFFGGGPAGDAWARGYVQREGRWVSRFDARLTGAVMGPVLSTERWQAWQQLRVPVDLVVAERSVLDEARVAQMLSARAGAGHHVVPDTGHDVHLERPTAFVALLEELIERRRAPPRA